MSRSYRQGSVAVEALRDVSFTLGGGEIGCVLGRSGSGKSTLLHVIGGLDRPDKGRIYIGDDEVGAMSERARVQLRRARLGFVFQSFNLIPSLTAAENVALPLRYAGVGDRAGRARAMLERVGLAARMDFLPQQMSGGEQQRVSLARALVAGPPLVLADEPTGELDSTTAAEIASLIGELNRSQGTTFLIVTHDEKLAETATRVFRMADGRLL